MNKVSLIEIPGDDGAYHDFKVSGHCARCNGECATQFYGLRSDAERLDLLCAACASSTHAEIKQLRDLLNDIRGALRTNEIFKNLPDVARAAQNAEWKAANFLNAMNNSFGYSDFDDIVETFAKHVPRIKDI